MKFIITSAESSTTDAETAREWRELGFEIKQATTESYRRISVTKVEPIQIPLYRIVKDATMEINTIEELLELRDRVGHPLIIERIDDLDITENTIKIYNDNIE